LNQAQRKVLVISLSAIAAIAGIWALVAVPILVVLDGGDGLWDMLEVIPLPLFWVPLLTAVTALIGALYLRAGGQTQADR